MKFKGTKVYNPNNPRKYYGRGGYIYPSSNMTKKQLNSDSVYGILQPGELVIPVKYKGKPLADKIAKMLKQNNIYLPHM